MHEILNTFSLTKAMFNKVFQARFGKLYIFIKVISAIQNSIFSLPNIILPGLIINELVEANGLKLTIYTTVLVISPLFNILLTNFLNHISFKLYQKINIEFLCEFEQHIAYMDYETLENPVIQDQKNRAEDTLELIISVVDYICSFVSSILTITALISILSTLNPIIALVNFLAVILNAKITKNTDKNLYEQNKSIQSKIRKQYGLHFNLRSLEHAKDIRIFDVFDFLLKKVVEYQESIDKDVQKTQTIRYKANISTTIINVIGQGILYGYLITDVLYGRTSIGSMTIGLSAANKFLATLSGITSTYLRLSNNTLKYIDYIEFMSIPETQYNSGSQEVKIKNDSIIEFKNVSFKYPNSKRVILSNLNLKIPINEKLCIVGENGAGKTTFVKLLLRLYAPSSGEILLDGKNINVFSYKSYLRIFAAVFQDFAQFNVSLGENIALTDSYNYENVDNICKTMGLQELATSTPKGYDTQVGKWIDSEGISFSGGEAQRMAIARAYYRGGYIYILDEPTAALDPRAEYDVYAQFNTMIRNKCAIVITHRLSAVQLADKVAVFDDGRVAEYGTHAELYAKGGIYTEMFDKQAQFYRDEVPATQNAQEQ